MDRHDLTGDFIGLVTKAFKEVEHVRKFPLHRSTYRFEHGDISLQRSLTYQEVPTLRTIRWNFLHYVEAKFASKMEIFLDRISLSQSMRHFHDAEAQFACKMIILQNFTTSSQHLFVDPCHAHLHTASFISLHACYCTMSYAGFICKGRVDSFLEGARCL